MFRRTRKESILILYAHRSQSLGSIPVCQGSYNNRDMIKYIVASNSRSASASTTMACGGSRGHWNLPGRGMSGFNLLAKKYPGSQQMD